MSPENSNVIDRILNLSGGQVRCRVMGEGNKDIVFVHGMSYPMEVWAPMLELASTDEFRLVSYDLYGRGFSDYDGRPLGSDVLAAQVLELMDLLSISKAHLVSLSNSDLVLCDLAAKTPERVRSISLVAPSGLDPRTMNPRMRWLTGFSAMIYFMGPYMRRKLQKRMKEHRMHLPADAPEISRESYDVSIRSVFENSKFASAVCSQIHHMPSTTEFESQLELIHKHRVPMFMLHFGEEKDSQESANSLFGRLCPHAVQLTQEQGGHMALLEYPTEVWAKLSAFISNL